MAKKKAEATEQVVQEAKKYDNTVRRWITPKRRSQYFAEELKTGVHTDKREDKYGKEKAGQPLTDYEKGIRSGYFMAQNDNAGMYKYKEAMQVEGVTKTQARNYSRKKGAKLREFFANLFN